MAITFVGEAEDLLTEVTLPSFVAGDLAVVQAYRLASTTAPALPTGWTSIATASSGSDPTSIAYRVGWRTLIGSDTTTGVWTNATGVAVIVLRGQASAPIGTSNSAGAPSSSMSWVATTFTNTSGSSWSLHLGAHFSATDVNTVALTGTTNRSGSTLVQACIHSNENATGWSTTAKTVNTSAPYTRVTAEILALVPPSRGIYQGVMSGVHKGVM